MTGKNDSVDDNDTATKTTSTASTNKNSDRGTGRDTENGAVKMEDEGCAHKTVDTAAPPDGGWGWAVVAASFTISLLVDGVCFSFGIFFDEFREEFGTSKAQTSWIGSVLNGSYLIFGVYLLREISCVEVLLEFSHSLGRHHHRHCRLRRRRHHHLRRRRHCTLFILFSGLNIHDSSLK